MESKEDMAASIINVRLRTFYIETGTLNLRVITPGRVGFNFALEGDQPCYYSPIGLIAHPLPASLQSLSLATDRSGSSSILLHVEANDGRRIADTSASKKGIHNAAPHPRAGD